MAASVQELLLAAQAKQKKSPLSALADLINSASQGYAEGKQIADLRSQTDLRRAEIAQKLVSIQQQQQETAAQEELRKQFQDLLATQSEQNIRTSQSNVAATTTAPTPAAKFEQNWNQDTNGRISRSLKEIKPKEPDIQSGYRMLPNGNMEYIPGGPADPNVKASLKTEEPNTTIYQDPNTGNVSMKPQNGWEARQLKVSEATKLLNANYNKNEAPTTQARNMGEMAATVIPHISDLRDTIHQAAQAGFIGPVSGRLYSQFLAGKVGTTGNPDADLLLGKLRSENDLMNTAVLRTHFGARGGQQVLEHFNNMLNTGKMSEAQLNGVLDTVENYMTSYAKMGGAAGEQQNNKENKTSTTSGETPAQRKARLIKELQSAPQ